MLMCIGTNINRSFVFVKHSLAVEYIEWLFRFSVCDRVPYWIVSPLCMLLWDKIRSASYYKRETDNTIE